MKPPELDAAPGRGQYDRALSRRARQDAQRERVISALTALSAAERDLSIANVVELAGIGRNTFYEYFDDIEHALAASDARALRELVVRAEATMQLARTPLERVRALARAWAETVLETGTLARLAMRAQSSARSAAQHSVLAQHVAVLLSEDLTARSGLPGLSDPLKVSAVAAVFDALSRAHFRVTPMTTEQLQGALTDFSLRLLR